MGSQITPLGRNRELWDYSFKCQNWSRDENAIGGWNEDSFKSLSVITLTLPTLFTTTLNMVSLVQSHCSVCHFDHYTLQHLVNRKCVVESRCCIIGGSTVDTNPLNLTWNPLSGFYNSSRIYIFMRIFNKVFEAPGGLLSLTLVWELCQGNTYGKLPTDLIQVLWICCMTEDSDPH